MFTRVIILSFEIHYFGQTPKQGDKCNDYNEIH